MEVKFFTSIVAYKKLFLLCIPIVFLTACNNHLAHGFSSTDNMDQELVFEDLSWMPTSDPSIVSIPLDDYPNTVPKTNITSVKINRNGYEIKVPYYSTNRNSYWYSIINNKIEIFCAIESNDTPMPRVTVIVTLKK